MLPLQYSPRSGTFPFIVPSNGLNVEGMYCRLSVMKEGSVIKHAIVIVNAYITPVSLCTRRMIRCQALLSGFGLTIHAGESLKP